MVDTTLGRVADYAKCVAGLNKVQSFIRDLFRDLEPADFHFHIPKFRWHAIVTTNYDLVIERAYENTPDRIQNVAPIIRDGDNFSEILKDQKLVPYLKLHGCISTINDPDLPLILGSEEYAKHRKNRARLFDHLKDWGLEHPILFCGYQIEDPNIQHILFNLDDKNIVRPPYALVRPSIDELDEIVWRGRRFETIRASLESFLRFLDVNLPDHTRALSTLVEADRLSIASRFKTNLQPSGGLIQYLDTELEHIHSGVATEGASPSAFYKGLTHSWEVFRKELDVRRKVTDDIILDWILDEDSTTTARCFLLKGHAGSGKSVTLRRAAWEAACEFDQLILYLREGGWIRKELLNELYTLIRGRLTIFIDDVIPMLPDVLQLIEFARREAMPITVIFGARTNEWNVYGEELAPELENEYDLRDLSEKEIGILLDKLEQHSCLGPLASRSREQRIDAFKLTAERQLIVALHEATTGKSFEEIIFDEYKNIVPDEAKILYLDICSLHRLGTPVRAGLIHRISGISFHHFGEKLLKPLEHVVRVFMDNAVRDYVYRSRHSLIAKFVFEQALRQPEDRVNQIIRMLKCMNVDYEADRIAFEQLIKGRELANLFAHRELADQIYKVAAETTADQYYIWHQRAVFELNHGGGSTRRAMEAIQKAEKNIKTDVTSIHHTKAMVLRKMALEAHNPLERTKYRNEAKEILHAQVLGKKDTYPFMALGEVLLDELRDKLRELSDEDTQSSDDALKERTIIGLSTEAEHVISVGLQRFPDNEMLLTLEANLSEVLQDQPRAVTALESAFKINPRRDGVAVRLARFYVRSGRYAEAKKVLIDCKDQNPASKMVHFELAKLYMRIDEIVNKDAISHHLKRSFTEGDSNYNAQIFFARHEFLYGDRQAALATFERIRDQHFPPKFRNRYRGEVRDSKGSLVEYKGYVKSLSDVFCFVPVAALGTDIFIYFSQFNPKDWNQVTNNTLVAFNLAFTVRGPNGINAKVVD